MFVIGSERHEPKKINTNDNIMNILNSNQIFYTQKPKDHKISFYQSHINKNDVKKILFEKKQALLEECEKKKKLRDELFQPVY